MQRLELSRSDYADLRAAFDESSYDTECYLDTDAGEVVWLSAETAGLEAEPDDDAPRWKVEAWNKRRAVWEDETGQFLRVPPADASDVRDDIELFLDEHADRRLRERFDTERPTRQAFEPFERALERDPSAREKWEQFRRERVRERIDEWLALRGYELEVTDD